MINKKQKFLKSFSQSEDIELGQRNMLLQDADKRGGDPKDVTKPISFQEKISKMKNEELMNLRDQLVEKRNQDRISGADKGPDYVDIYVNRVRHIDEMFQIREEALNQTRMAGVHKIDSTTDIAIRDVKRIIESDSFEQIVNGEAVNNILVAQLQQSLKILGYDLGKTGVLRDGVDGFYEKGGETAQIVERFKIDQGMIEQSVDQVRQR